MASSYRIISHLCIAAVLVVLSSVSVSSSPLRFKSNGRFKILQIADMHYANGKSTRCLDVFPSQLRTCSDLNTTAFTRRMIKAEKPDLIVFTGDNIFAMDSNNATESLNLAYKPAIEAGIPWAAVLGNHDQEFLGPGMGRKQVMQYIVSMPGTLSKFNPPNRKIDGFGNYYLQVVGAPGSVFKDSSVLNLYFVDSGDYAKNPLVSYYDWIKPSQISWFRDTSGLLQKLHKRHSAAKSDPPPGLVYFHIPLPEYADLKTSMITGVKQENISSPRHNSEFMKAMEEAGDIKAAFVGHDHLNDFCGNLRGIELCYGGGFGYHAYGKAGWSRRSRVIEVSLEKNSHGKWTSVKTISTWKRLDDAHLSKIDLQTLWQKETSKVWMNRL